MLLYVSLLPGMLHSAMGQQLQVGIAGWPGIGIQVAYIDSRTVYSLETVLQIDYDPFATRSMLHVAGSAGVALLPLNIWRTIGQADYGYDLDLGMRLGPRIVFVDNPTRADKNQQFGLFIDPFLRFRWRTSALARFWYFEVGATRPVLRVGVWLAV